MSQSQQMQSQDVVLHSREWVEPTIQTHSEMPISSKAPTISLEHEAALSAAELMVVGASLAVALWYLWRKFISPKTRGCASCGKTKSCCEKKEVDLDELPPLPSSWKVSGGADSATSPVAQRQRQGDV